MTTMPTSTASRVARTRCRRRRQRAKRDRATMRRIRCAWIDESRLSPDDFVLYRDYHDTEWGQPLRDSKALFERVTLEAFQSGLSWLIILRKRENFRRAFHQFDVERVARYGERDITRLMADAGIVRNRAKIEATIANARAVGRSGCRPRRVAVVVRAAVTAAAGRHGRRPGGHPGVHRDGQGTEAARLPIRRADDRLRLDAGDRNGRRPHRRLLGASDNPVTRRAPSRRSSPGLCTRDAADREQ